MIHGMTRFDTHTVERVVGLVMGSEYIQGKLG